MLRSDFSRKANTSIQNFFLYSMSFFQLIGVKLTSNSFKIEVHIESNFHFGVSIDVFNHFDATNIKIRLF